MGTEEKRTPAAQPDGGTAEARLANMDLAGGVAVFCFGLFVFLSGVHMCFFAVTGAKVWYYSPGFFPCFIGAVLMLASLILVLGKRRAGARLGKGAFTSADPPAARRGAWRLLLSVGLFALYVFVLIGTLPFVLATFLYLAVTMILFRRDGYPVWKLLLISAAAAGAVYLFFGVVASVPLP
jgi:hypothetical protein